MKMQSPTPTLGEEDIVGSDITLPEGFHSESPATGDDRGVAELISTHGDDPTVLAGTEH